MLTPLGKRVEEVIAQPLGKRDVPSPPEFSHVDREVRLTEVLRQPNAQQQSRAHGNVRVAREVEEQLQRVAIDAHQCLDAGVECRRIEDAAHQVVGQVVGNQQLLYQANADQQQRSPAVFSTQGKGLGELGEQLTLARNGPRRHRREKQRGGQIRQATPRRLHFAQIEIDGVSKRLKTIERKTECEQPREASSREQRNQLEPHKQSQVDSQRDPKQGLADAPGAPTAITRDQPGNQRMPQPGAPSRSG